MPRTHLSPRLGTGAARRFRPGDVVPARELTTIRSERIVVPAPDALTHVQFRRFASCPICNVHVRSVARRHDEIAAAGIREVVVFHSTADAMLPHQGGLPFAAVADPNRELYAEFGVEFSYRSVLHPRAWTAPLKPYAWSVAMRERRAPGGKWFSIRGDSMLGLPANFLIGVDGRVLAAKYGRHANDQWSVDELLHLARTPRAGGSYTPSRSPTHR
ncbi:MAG: peroxiredoxin-like family protein [Streptosporangiaceae bacterium]